MNTLPTMAELAAAEEKALAELKKRAIEIADMAPHEQLHDKQLHQLCVDWGKWWHSKKLFVPPQDPGLLGRMQPRKSGEIPDHILRPILAFLNVAISGMENSREKAAFIMFYRDNVKNVRKVAREMGISRPTFYNYVKRFRREAYHKAVFLEKVHFLHKADKIGQEVED